MSCYLWFVEFSICKVLRGYLIDLSNPPFFLAGIGFVPFASLHLLGFLRFCACWIPHEVWGYLKWIIWIQSSRNCISAWPESVCATIGSNSELPGLPWFGLASWTDSDRAISPKNLFAACLWVPVIGEFDLVFLGRWDGRRRMRWNQRRCLIVVLDLLQFPLLSVGVVCHTIVGTFQSFFTPFASWSLVVSFLFLSWFIYCRCLKLLDLYGQLGTIQHSSQILHDCFPSSKLLAELHFIPIRVLLTLPGLTWAQ